MYLHNQYHVYMQYTWYMYIYKCISHRVAKKIWSSCWDTTSNLSKLASCLPFSPIKRKGMWAWQLLGGGSVEGFQTISGWIVCLLGSVFQLIFWVSLGNTPRMFTYHVSSSFVGCNGQVFGLLAVFFQKEGPELDPNTTEFPMKHGEAVNDKWRCIDDMRLHKQRKKIRISTSSLNLFQAFVHCCQMWFLLKRLQCNAVCCQSIMQWQPVACCLPRGRKTFV